jgi:hypothetical protein
MLRIPHCLDSRLTDGGQFVSPTHRSRSTPQKHNFSASGTRFCQRLSKPQGLVLLEGLGKLKKLNCLIGSRTHYLPSCSIVPQPLRYRLPHRTCNCGNFERRRTRAILNAKYCNSIERYVNLLICPQKGRAQSCPQFLPVQVPQLGPLAD